MNTLSAVIITRDEAANIGRCLESIKEVADEIIVVDSGSTDATKDICQSFNAQFLHRDWSGYGDQKNFGNSMASSEFILSIDADEALSTELKKSILANKTKGFQAHSYSFNRLTNYCGQWIKHGGWYPDRKTRLWKKGLTSWEGNIHEKLVLEIKDTQHLEGDLLHYSYPNMETHIERSIYYARLGASKMYASEKRVSIFKLIFSPAFTFFRKYFLRMGILDGYYGYVIAKNASFYNFYKYALLRSYWKQHKPKQS
jgi:glycosyltransferase involved in cell wall biosynthesis